MYTDMYVDVYNYVNIDTHTNVYNHTLNDEYVNTAVYDYARICMQVSMSIIIIMCIKTSIHMRTMMCMCI